MDHNGKVFNETNEFNVKTGKQCYVIISVVIFNGVDLFDNLCDQTIDLFVKKNYFLCYVHRCEAFE